MIEYAITLILAKRGKKTERHEEHTKINDLVSVERPLPIFYGEIDCFPADD